MKCAEVREEFSALIDGELAPDARAAVESHIAQCSDCLRDLDAIKRIDRSYRGLPTQSAPGGFEEGVRKALAPAAAQFVNSLSPFDKLWPRQTVARPRWWPVLAAAALVLVVLGTVTLREQRRASVLTTASNMKEDSAQAQKLSRQQSAAPDVVAETKGQLDALGYVGAKTAPASPPAPLAEELTSEAVGRRLKAVGKQNTLSLQPTASSLQPDASVASAPPVAAREPVRALAEPPRDGMRMRESEERGIISAPLPLVAAAPASAPALEPARAATPPPPPPTLHVEAYAPAKAAEAAPPHSLSNGDKLRAEMPVRAGIADRHTDEAQPVKTSPKPEPESGAQQYMARGDALRDQGEIGRAVKNYQSAVELAPENVDALIKLGDALLQQDKKEDALRCFTEAVRLDPRNTAAHCGLGRALELLGRKDEAVRHFKQAIEIDPKCGPAKQGIERLQPARRP